MSLSREEAAKRAAAIAKAAMATRKSALARTQAPDGPDLLVPTATPQEIKTASLQQVLDGAVEMSRASRGVLVVWKQRSRIALSVTWPATLPEGPQLVESSRLWGERARQGHLVAQEQDGRHVYCAPLKVQSGEAGYLYLERPLTAGTFGPWEEYAGLTAANNAAALVGLTRSYGDLAGSYQRLQVINQLIRNLSTNLPIQTIYEEVLRACLAISGAEVGGFLVGGRMRLVATLDAHGQSGVELEPSRAALDQARKLRRPQALVDTPAGIEQANQRSLMVTGVRSVILVPLLAADNLLGVVYLSSQVAKRTFGKDDETALEALATQTATALERAMLYQELEGRVIERTSQLAKANDELKRLNEALDAKVKHQVDALRKAEKLHRYLAPNVVEAVMRSPNESDCILGRTSRKKLTVFFSDIRGFTSFSESQEPEDVISLLNEYLNHMTALIHHHEGTLNKFLGDGIMGFFGDPIPMPDHAQRAVRMAMAMQVYMKSLQAKWFDQGHQPLQIGVGINTGYVTVGNIGSEIFTDYTVIGTQVNLAARIQSLANPGEVVISHSTYAQVKDIVEVEPRGEVTVKGLRSPVLVYHVIRLLDDGKPTDDEGARLDRSGSG